MPKQFETRDHSYERHLKIKAGRKVRCTPRTGISASRAEQVSPEGAAEEEEEEEEAEEEEEQEGEERKRRREREEIP